MKNRMTAKTTITCISCNRDQKVRMSEYALKHWLQNRENLPLIQDWFPSLSDHERELILSGICGTCFDELYETNQ